MKRLASTAVILFAISLGALAAELSEATDEDIGYASPDAALAAMRAKPGVNVVEHADWIVASDVDAHTVWAFAVPGHRAYPTAVKRTFSDRRGAVRVAMRVKCGAAKATCDQVVIAFRKLNATLERPLFLPGDTQPKPSPRWDYRPQGRLE